MSELVPEPGPDDDVTAVVQVPNPTTAVINQPTATTTVISIAATAAQPVVGAGPPGAPGAVGLQTLYIQSTQPTQPGPWAWLQPIGNNYTMWVGP